LGESWNEDRQKLGHLDSRRFERKGKPTRAGSSHDDGLQSYSDADEPEKPRDGEEKGLSYVLGRLRPAQAWRR
jgi:hypothetical protein